MTAKIQNKFIIPKLTFNIQNADQEQHKKQPHFGQIPPNTTSIQHHSKATNTLKRSKLFPPTNVEPEHIHQIEYSQTNVAMANARAKAHVASESLRGKLKATCPKA